MSMEAQSGQLDRQKAPVASNQSRENLVRFNYHEDNEGLINRQINLELYASYAYMAMAHHFDRSDVALKGHYKFFKKCPKKKMNMQINLWNIKINVVGQSFF